MKISRLVLAALAATACTPVLAQTQAQPDDVIIMRKPLTDPRPGWNAGNGNGQQPGGDTGGQTMPPPPPAWFVGPYSAGSTCSAASERTRTVECRQVSGGTTTVLPDDRCPGPVPARTETVADYSTCSHAWRPGEWEEGAESCTDSELQTRSVTCRRTLDDALVDDALCNEADRLVATREVPDHSGCTYSWIEGEWEPWSSTCSNVAVRTRTVTCERSDGTPATDVQCLSNGAGNKPPVQEGPKPNATNCSSQLQNGGFENGTSPWTFAGDAALNNVNDPRNANRAIQSGAWSARFKGGSANYVQQVVPTVAGQQYTVSYWAWHFGSRYVRLRINGVQVGNAAIGSNGNGAWFQWGGSFTATGSTTTIRFEPSSSDGTYHVDGVIMTLTPSN